jgi:antitoxin YefM
MEEYEINSTSSISPKWLNTMNILNFTEARACLKQTMDDVCRDHQPTVITRQGAEAVVMLSLSDYNSIEETLYLLSSENNARRLRSAISQVRAGKTKFRELINNGEKEPQSAEQS